MDTNLAVAALTSIILAVIIAYVRVRSYRSKERLAAIEKGLKLELYVTGQMLRSIPWQSWAGSVILVLLILAYFISSRLQLNQGEQSFLELIKYLTGAVVGSLFGKGSEGRADSTLKG